MSLLRWVPIHMIGVLIKAVNLSTETNTQREGDEKRHREDAL